MTAGQQGPPLDRPPVGRLTRWWGRVTIVIYHLLFAVFLIVTLPVLVWRFLFDKRYRSGLLHRSGRVDPSPPGSRCIWVHGVSVGEVKGAGTLIERLRAEHPELEVVVSTTTPTGQQVARDAYPDTRIIYYPLDLGWCPGRALDRIRPECVLLMELEVWPNFLQAAADRGLPIAVINGRISESSFRGYRLVRWLLPQFRYIALYCVQIEVYRQRLAALGIDAARIPVTGNMKYDSVSLKTAPATSARLRAWLTPAGDGARVLVCGSTHGREDEWIAEAVRGLSRPDRVVRLVTVPRHPERAPAVVDTLRNLGYRVLRWSELTDDLPRLGAADAIVVDVVGRLEEFYGACDVAYVGGSLVPHGGQNMIEPAALGRAVAFGPHTENFRTDVDLLLAADAAVRIESVDGLGPVLARLLDDEGECVRLAERAREVIRSNQGATDRTYRLLRPLIEWSGRAQAR